VLQFAANAMKEYWPFRRVRNNHFSLGLIFSFTGADLIKIENKFGACVIKTASNTFNHHFEKDSRYSQLGIFLGGSSACRDKDESTHPRVIADPKCAMQECNKSALLIALFFCAFSPIPFPRACFSSGGIEDCCPRRGGFSQLHRSAR
jgi:hypothetical protein